MFSPVFVADAKITFIYNFVAPLKSYNITLRVKFFLQFSEVALRRHVVWNMLFGNHTITH